MVNDPQIQNLSAEKRALIALRQMKSRLESMERSRSEPVAVIGLGCRFPGAAADAASFWNNLRQGVDAITEIPADRWDLDRYYDPAGSV